MAKYITDAIARKLEKAGVKGGKLVDFLASLPVKQGKLGASVPDIAKMTGLSKMDEALARKFGKAYGVAKGVGGFGAGLATYLPEQVLGSAARYAKEAATMPEAGLKGALKKQVKMGAAALPAGVAIIGGGLAGKATSKMPVARAFQRIAKGAATGGITGGMIGGTSEGSKAALEDVKVSEAIRRTLGGVGKGGLAGAAMGAAFAGAGEVGKGIAKFKSRKSDAELAQNWQDYNKLSRQAQVEHTLGNTEKALQIQAEANIKLDAVLGKAKRGQEGFVNLFEPIVKQPTKRESDYYRGDRRAMMKTISDLTRENAAKAKGSYSAKSTIPVPQKVIEDFADAGLTTDDFSRLMQNTSYSDNPVAGSDYVSGSKLKTMEPKAVHDYLVKHGFSENKAWSMSDRIGDLLKYGDSLRRLAQSDESYAKLVQQALGGTFMGRKVKEGIISEYQKKPSFKYDYQKMVESETKAKAAEAVKTKTSEALAAIKPEEFKAYRSVQDSGVTNMFDVRTVSELSGLPKDKILAIMQGYGDLKAKFEGGQAGFSKLFGKIGESDTGYPNQPKGYEKYVQKLEGEGLTRSDAQGAADVYFRKQAGNEKFYPTMKKAPESGGVNAGKKPTGFDAKSVSNFLNWAQSAVADVEKAGGTKENWKSLVQEKLADLGFTGNTAKGLLEGVLPYYEGGFMSLPAGAGRAVADVAGLAALPLAAKGAMKAGKAMGKKLQDAFQRRISK